MASPTQPQFHQRTVHTGKGFLPGHFVSVILHFKQREGPLLLAKAHLNILVMIPKLIIFLFYGNENISGM